MKLILAMLARINSIRKPKVVRDKDGNVMGVE
jgi:hypothetical protein